MRLNLVTIFPIVKKKKTSHFQFHNMPHKSILNYIHHWNLGFALPCISSDDQLINWSQRVIDFVKIKFHLNEDIEWHYMIEIQLNWIEIKYINWNLNWFELNYNSTKLNSNIGLRFNWIQIHIQLKKCGMKVGGERIESFLMNMVLGKINRKHTFSCLFTWEWGKQILG